MNAMSFRKWVVLAAMPSVWGCIPETVIENGGGSEVGKETDSAISADSCFQLKEVRTSEVSPAGVRTVFQVLDCVGGPVSDLKTDELTVRLDGESLQSEGGLTPVLNEKVDFEQYALLLLDLSDSIVDSSNLSSMVSAARYLLNRLRERGVRIAVYQFAGPQYFAEVQSFTADKDLLDAALDEIAASKGLGTTDLYGSIPKALNILDAAGDPNMLVNRNLIVFTDGTDEAKESTFSAASYAVGATSAGVFTIGLGGDVDKEELVAFGKDGFEWAKNAENLDSAFSKLTDRIETLAQSYYLLGICSPRTSGVREIEIAVSRGEAEGSLTVTYDATGFDVVGCNVTQTAFPCDERECGIKDGFYCGTCTGESFCNDDFVCEDACDKKECGINRGVNCGDCVDKGDTFVCNDEFACEDACVNAECGSVLGVECGDCADKGETFFCNGEFVCEDACVNADCGIVSGVDCGDCASLGDGFGCDETHRCIDACFDVECGDVLGVDCGGCGAGFECTSQNVCAPNSVAGVSWSKIQGGVFSLGCDLTVDASCGFDETFHDVELSQYWMMTTEVTVGMMQSCIDDGACNQSEFESGGTCNFGTGEATLPMNCIGWAGLKAFCTYVGGDLPTEAEWERAARGDHDGTIASYWAYPWGNSPDPTCDRVVMSEGGPGCGTDKAQAVGGKPETAFGLVDMAGNAAEWTADFYGETFAACGSEPCLNPKGPIEGDARVIRGGAFDDLFASSFRSAKRDKEDPWATSPAVGGRCVKR